MPALFKRKKRWFRRKGGSISKMPHAALQLGIADICLVQVPMSLLLKTPILARLHEDRAARRSVQQFAPHDA